MLGIGASTESPLNPPWVREGADRIGVYQHCAKCGRINRLTTNGVTTVTGAAMARGRRWAREQWQCRAGVTR